MLSHSEHFYSLFHTRLIPEEWFWLCLESLELYRFQANFFSHSPIHYKMEFYSLKKKKPLKKLIKGLFKISSKN